MPSNIERASWAKAALETFMKQTGTDPEDAVRDLIADLIHYMITDPDSLSLDLFWELRAGIDHAQSEIEQELNPGDSDIFSNLDPDRPITACFETVMDALWDADEMWKNLRAQRLLLEVKG